MSNCIICHKRVFADVMINGKKAEHIVSEKKISSAMLIDPKSYVCVCFECVKKKRC